MRLLQITPQGDLTFTRDLIEGKDIIPPYAILSHTWEEDHNEEVLYNDIKKTRGFQKRGYQKILFCSEQAKRDGLEYFWVDTCCIDKKNAAELSESINSMFRWYQHAAKCYVYLSDVSYGSSSEDEPPRSTWKQELRRSRWFTRGWTLQELLAPSIVEFYASDAKKIGNKQSLSQTIHEITGIPIRALHGTPLSTFSVEERMSWSKSRTTSRKEDKAYSLLGILSVSLVANYGEGEQNAFERLRSEISMRSPLRVLGKLPVADGAAYDSHANEHNTQCLRGTRTEVLRDIATWVKDPSSKAVYWLNGMAGTGKSTISRTIANKFSKEDALGGHLGATFFFKRGEGDRGDISKFFTTVTSQLIQKVPEMAGYVQAAVDAEPTLTSKGMQTQFDALIVDPLSRVSINTSTPCTLLVVVDALDECEREVDIRLLIKLLSSIPRAMTVQLKFFLTSRPELPIRLGFNAVNGTYRDLILHEVAESIIENDLSVYLNHELGRIQREHNRVAPSRRRLPVHWPCDTDLKILVKMANPLFIFAATICRFIGDGRIGSPDEQLREVLRYRTKSQESQLNATYVPVLRHMTIGISNRRAQQRIVDRFSTVVGAIVTLADPLSSPALAQLLDIPMDKIDDTLQTLHSVLNIPQMSEKPIRLLHLSFRDFLVDPTRREDPFWIDERKVHKQLTEGCLRILNSSLKNNICDIQAPGTVASSISPIEIRTKISPELQYACRFWVHHFRNLSSPDLVTTDVWEFLSLHFLQWLEVMSWIGRLSESLDMIQSLRSVRLENCHNISNFCADSERFIQAMATSIQTAPLQVYSSALIFSPHQSIVRSLYQEDISRCVGLAPQMPLSWGERQATLEGHTDWVTSVAFSPDGQWIASASRDQTVILWSTTGERQATLQGHTDWVTSVAFSPDGRIASASRDQTVILWSAAGERQATLQGHTDWVTSIAFSPDSRIASASRDQTVILWSAAGERQATLQGHTDWVTSVAFSPNGRIASASHDKVVILWSATGERQITLQGHTDWVTSVAFSPDGRIGSASRDKTVILWSVVGEKQITLLGHADSVTSIAFSRDGQRIASASDDATIILSSAVTGEKQATLQGYAGWVTSVAFSPDGRIASGSVNKTVIIWSAIAERQTALQEDTKWISSVAISPNGLQIASASDDATVTLWSAATGTRQATLQGHLSWINLVAFSPDSRQIASASNDKTVILWSAATGTKQATLQGHTDRVISVAFSPDSRQIASVSSDKTVILWSAATGTKQATLQGHTDRVISVAFSPDSRQIASASNDKTVIIWSAATGAKQATLQGHTDPVISVAFSPDSRQIASASIDETVIIWLAVTGRKRHVLRTGFVGNVRFNSTATQILSEHRAWNIMSQNCNESEEPLPLPPNDVTSPSCALSLDNCWVMKDGQNVLYLPIECRPQVSAVSGNYIVLGCFNKVLILSII